MTWTVSFTQDTEVKGLGTLSAVFDDGTIRCQHTERTDTNGDFGRFIDNCNATLANVREQRGEMDAICAKVSAVLNGGK